GSCGDRTTDHSPAAHTGAEEAGISPDTRGPDRTDSRAGCRWPAREVMGDSWSVYWAADSGAVARNGLPWSMPRWSTRPWDGRYAGVPNPTGRGRGPVPATGWAVRLRESTRSVPRGRWRPVPTP